MTVGKSGKQLFPRRDKPHGAARLHPFDSVNVVQNPTGGGGGVVVVYLRRLLGGGDSTAGPGELHRKPACQNDVGIVATPPVPSSERLNQADGSSFSLLSMQGIHVPELPAALQRVLPALDGNNT